MDSTYIKLKIPIIPLEDPPLPPLQSLGSDLQKIAEKLRFAFLLELQYRHLILENGDKFFQHTNQPISMSLQEKLELINKNLRKLRPMPSIEIDIGMIMDLIEVGLAYDGKRQSDLGLEQWPPFPSLQTSAADCILQLPIFIETIDRITSQTLLMYLPQSKKIANIASNFMQHELVLSKDLEKSIEQQDYKKIFANSLPELMGISVQRLRFGYEKKMQYLDDFILRRQKAVQIVLKSGDSEREKTTQISNDQHVPEKPASPPSASGPA